MQAEPLKSRRSPTLIAGTLFGVGAALAWAAGFIAAKHGLQAGFTPADLVLHRFLWSGLVMMPFLFRDGIRDLGGVGWLRGAVLAFLSGPPQGLFAYAGFLIVPLGHGATIQPASATLTGIVLAAVMLRERPSVSRILGAVAITAGLVIFGIESFAIIGSHGIGADLLFASAGGFWALFGILLRKWQVTGLRVSAVVGTMSVLVYLPLYLLFADKTSMLSMPLAEHLIQIVMLGLVAGILPIFLFARAVMLLGAGRTATFPALVPVFSMLIGFLVLGIVPSLAQVIGLAIVVLGFRFTLR